MTIVEAAIAVMRASKRPMTAKDVYEAITASRLFEFNAKDPVRVVDTQLKRHSSESTLAHAPKAKHFVRVEGARYTLM